MTENRVSEEYNFSDSYKAQFKDFISIKYDKKLASLWMKFDEEHFNFSDRTAFNHLISRLKHDIESTIKNFENIKKQDQTEISELERHLESIKVQVKKFLENDKEDLDDAYSQTGKIISKINKTENYLNPIITKPPFKSHFESSIISFKNKFDVLFTSLRLNITDLRKKLQPLFKKHQQIQEHKATSRSIYSKKNYDEYEGKMNVVLCSIIGLILFATATFLIWDDQGKYEEWGTSFLIISVVFLLYLLIAALQGEGIDEVFIDSFEERNGFVGIVIGVFPILAAWSISPNIWKVFLFLFGAIFISVIFFFLLKFISEMAFDHQEEGKLKASESEQRAFNNKKEVLECEFTDNTKSFLKELSRAIFFSTPEYNKSVADLSELDSLILSHNNLVDDIVRHDKYMEMVRVKCEGTNKDLKKDLKKLERRQDKWSIHSA
jgi:hypothetical protein